ncbi:hypothetical protein [Luteibacter yeojuensis]|uniref:Uncharacterized protein n=1 Tax=Luteibacter yeojuensis TaxID=345309 RepID=A0A0F3KUD0_9GAMM|nr:hypothetical protein [Luteibacter yeojuensis]KJV34833.1 hypothetical protein VI08_09675 [Luteibacter yeojuensis]
MNVRAWRAAMLFLACMVVRSEPVNPDLQKCQAWLGAFFGDSTTARDEAFKSYDMESQYQIVMCGNQVLHPPAMELATLFAGQGAAVVPLLKAKLSRADDDLTIRDIVYVFSEMKRLHAYDPAGDAELSMLMARKVDGMHYNGWKTLVQADLNEMRSNAR